MGAIIGIKYDGGIVVASDRVISYGRCVKFGNFTHFVEITPSCVIGASGEVGDFQELVDTLQAIVNEHECRTSGEHLTPAEIYTQVKRILYYRRSKMHPLQVKIVVAGINPDGNSFLAAADMYGTSWEDDVVCTGIAVHMKGLQLDRAVHRSRDEVCQAIRDVWQAIRVKYVLSVSEVELLDITSTGINKLEPMQVTVENEICEGTWDQEVIELE